MKRRCSQHQRMRTGREELAWKAESQMQMRHDWYKSLSQMQPPAGIPGSSQKLSLPWLTLNYVGQPIAATLNTSPARQELSNSKPDQSLLSPSAAMTGLNPKCILHTQSSSLIFTATCFNSSLSRCARQTGTQESASALKIISRPSSANVDNQIY